MGKMFFIALSFLVAGIAHADLEVIQPERSHGYFIGDIIQQRVNLESSVGVVAAKNIESGLRINDYLYRLPTQEISIQRQTWLELRYQIINAPVQTESIALPAVLFVSNSGQELMLQPWSLTVSPLTTTDGEEAVSLLPDRQALEIIQKPNNQLLLMSIVALAAVLVLWALWWLFRHFKDSHTLPFAQALREINKLPAAERDTTADSWIALHHAFNKLGGKTVNHSNLDQFFQTVPWLGKHREAVTEFFAASSERFYQQAEPRSVAVDKLCRALVRDEKRQAKQPSSKAVGMSG